MTLDNIQTAVDVARRAVEMAHELSPQICAAMVASWEAEGRRTVRAEPQIVAALTDCGVAHTSGPGTARFAYLTDFGRVVHAVIVTSAAEVLAYAERRDQEMPKPAAWLQRHRDGQAAVMAMRNVLAEILGAQRERAANLAEQSDEPGTGKLPRVTGAQRYALRLLAAARTPFEVNSVALDLHGRTRRALRDKGLLGFDGERYVLTELGRHAGSGCTHRCMQGRHCDGCGCPGCGYSGGVQ